MNERDWIVMDTFNPGYFGKNKDQVLGNLNEHWGAGEWQIQWRLANGLILSREAMFEIIFVNSYLNHFLANPNDASIITNFSYAYDKDQVTREQAFEPFYLYDKPGVPNQIHHVGINIAIQRLGLPFRGDTPIHVRNHKPGEKQDFWPAGWRWHPGKIRATYPVLTPKIAVQRKWDWGEGSIEEQYQKSKILQVKRHILEERGILQT